MRVVNIRAPKEKLGKLLDCMTDYSWVGNVTSYVTEDIAHINCKVKSKHTVCIQ